MEQAGGLIREFQPDDRRQVEECIAELQDFSKRLYSKMAQGQTVAAKYLEHLLARCGEWNGEIFVAEIDSRVVGMACVYAKIKSKEPDEEEYEYAYISDLVVLPDYRGTGIGRVLLRRAEDYAKHREATLLRINV